MYMYVHCTVSWLALLRGSSLVVIYVYTDVLFTDVWCYVATFEMYTDTAYN